MIAVSQSITQSIHQSISTSCLWETSGRSTDTNWENNIHSALIVQGMHACAEPCVVNRFAVRENDGADYVISMGGRMNPSLLDLIPAFCNVRLRFVDNSTMHSDTCSFQKALMEFGKPRLL